MIFVRPPSSVVRIEDGLTEGDTLTFNVTANFIVDYFDGTKSLVISNTGDLGGKMSYWAESMTTVGIIVLALALFLAVRRCCCLSFTIAAGLQLPLLRLCVLLLLSPLLHVAVALLRLRNRLCLGNVRIVCPECVDCLCCLLCTSTDYRLLLFCILMRHVVRWWIVSIAMFMFVPLLILVVRLIALINHIHIIAHCCSGIGIPAGSAFRDYNCSCW